MSNGSWAGDDAGWTEGDKWAYTFDVMHDIPGLYVRNINSFVPSLTYPLRRIELKGGNTSFIKFLDEHFGGGWSINTLASDSSHIGYVGHNDHTNEPSHHIPYLYTLAGAPSKAQARIRSIATVDYNATADGLAGVRSRHIFMSHSSHSHL